MNERLFAETRNNDSLYPFEEFLEGGWQELPIAPPTAAIAAQFSRTSALPLLGWVPDYHSSIPPRPLRVGIFFSGGQAPGGHNVVWALHSLLKRYHPESSLWGIPNGPKGLLEGTFRLLEESTIFPFRNIGGFHLLGSGREKIETFEQCAICLQNVRNYNLDGVVIVGGDDSNTNAAVLADYFAQHDSSTVIVGVPKTIDGDLISERIELPFGFDSATKSYAHSIGSIALDALSAKKYYHFIRLMGRSASHITLECALQTQPNLALISEEMEREDKNLQDVVEEIVRLIEERGKSGLNYGIILIPEGLLESLRDIKKFLYSLNNNGSDRLQQAMKALSLPLPKEIQEQLMLDRDPHGNVRVSQIEVERLLIILVKEELRRRNFPLPFQGLPHFLGYEGRSCYPSNFDANYCKALGLAAFHLIREGRNGYIVALRNLIHKPREWRIEALPIVSLLHFEERKGVLRAVVKKSLVNLEENCFRYFSSLREGWRLSDDYRDPGPIQFYDRNGEVYLPPLSLQISMTKCYSFSSS